MSRSIWGLGLLVVLGCSGAGAGARAPAATPDLAGPSESGAAPAMSTRASSSRASAQSGSASGTLEYHDETEADRRFIENAERAIAEYSEFIARAGDSAEYAPAVKRSREQIEDLREAIVFVRAGAAQRAAH
jgi:hypothetical protein